MALNATHLLPGLFPVVSPAVPERPSASRRAEPDYNASARTERANESVAKTIDEVAQEIEAGLIVCGQRGRGAMRSALLGSVSHALATHTKRQVLIAPQHST